MDNEDREPTNNEVRATDVLVDMDPDYVIDPEMVDSRAVAKVAKALNAAETRGRKQTIDLRNAIVSKVERKATINDCIVALETNGHPPHASMAFPIGVLRNLLDDTPAREKKHACVEHLWEHQKDGFMHCISPGCGVSKEAYTTGTAKAKEPSV